MAQTPINVVATFKAKQGMESRVREALERAVAPTLSEDTNRGYLLHQGIQDPAIFVLYEGWTSAEALDEHLKKPHLQQLVKDLDGTLDHPFEVTTLRQIAGEAPS